MPVSGAHLAGHVPEPHHADREVGDGVPPVREPPRLLEQAGVEVGEDVVPHPREAVGVELGDLDGRGLGQGNGSKQTTSVVFRLQKNIHLQHKTTS